MKRGIAFGGTLFGLAVFAFAIFFATRPSAAFEQLSEAIAKQDQNAMSRFVDFPSLRESVKIRLRDELSASAAGSSNPMVFLGVVLAGALVDPLVEILVSPRGIAAMMSGHKMREISKNPTPTGGQEVSRDSLQFTTAWEGPSRYAVTVTSNGNPTIVLVLHRYGLFEWRLAELR